MRASSLGEELLGEGAEWGDGRRDEARADEVPISKGGGISQDCQTRGMRTQHEAVGEEMDTAHKALGMMEAVLGSADKLGTGERRR